MTNYKNLSVLTCVFWICALYCICGCFTSVQSKHHHRRHKSTQAPTSETTQNHRSRHESRRASELCTAQLEDETRMKELRGGSTRCRCPHIHAPVCGSDGITYHNRCYLECASEETYHRFRQRKITLEKWGPCDESMRTLELGRIGSSSSSSGGPGFGLNFWEKECPFINKRENCTPIVRSFCTSDFPQVKHQVVSANTK